MFFGVPTIVLCAIVGCLTTVHAGWWRTYGGPTNDYGYCVQIISDSSYIIGASKGNDLWLFKVDTLGSTIWERTYGGSDYWRGKWVEQTTDGGYIVASRHPTLLKTDDNGDTLWTRNFGVFSYCVRETSEGDYIVVGGDNGNEGDTYLKLLKTDVHGDTQWTSTYVEAGHNLNSGFFVQETSDSGYIITGATGIGSEEYETRYLWLIKVDSEGDTVWTRKYGTGQDGDYFKGYCVKQTSDGGFIITGWRGGLWLLKTDELGDTLWTKIYGAGPGYYVQETDDGGYILTGGSQTGTLSATPQLSDLLIVKTDSVGDSIWARSYGGPDGDVGRCIQPTADHGYIVVGCTWSFGSGYGDVYLLKTDSLGLLAVSEEPTTNVIRRWDAVTSIGPQVVIRYWNTPLGFEATVFDACGRKVDELRSSGASGSIHWGHSFSQGVYFIQAMDNRNQLKIAKVVLVR